LPLYWRNSDKYTWNDPYRSPAAVATTVAAVGVLGSVGSFLDLRLRPLNRSGLGVAVSVTVGFIATVLSPLVVVSTDLAGVLLVIVGVGLDEVVRLAVARVGVRAVSGIGPLIVVVTLLGSRARSRGCVVSAVSGSLTVAVALGATVATVAAVAAVGALGGTVRSVVVVTGRGSGTVGGGTVDILVGTVGIITPVIGIRVVPLIVGLGIVGLSPGLLVRLLNTQVLIAAV